MNLFSLLISYKLGLMKGPFKALSEDIRSASFLMAMIYIGFDNNYDSIIYIIFKLYLNEQLIMKLMNLFFKKKTNFSFKYVL